MGFPGAGHRELLPDKKGQLPLPRSSCRILRRDIAAGKYNSSRPIRSLAEKFSLWLPCRIQLPKLTVTVRTYGKQKDMVFTKQVSTAEIVI